MRLHVSWRICYLQLVGIWNFSKDFSYYVLSGKDLLKKIEDIFIEAFRVPLKILMIKRGYRLQ